jgi:hypothetical protein
MEEHERKIKRKSLIERLMGWAPNNDCVKKKRVLPDVNAKGF